MTAVPTTGLRRRGVLLLAGVALAGCGSGAAAAGPVAGSGPVAGAGQATGVTSAAGPAAGQPAPAPAGQQPPGGGGGGGGGGGRSGSGQSTGTRTGTDTLTVSRCWTNATATHGGQLLIQVTSSDPSARILAYRPDGSLIGEVLNSIGVSRRDLPLMPYQQRDPVRVTLVSSSGARITVPTTPFEQD